MVLKGVNKVHNDKIRWNGPEQSQMGTQYENWVKWSWKESIRYTMIKLGKWSWKGSIVYTMTKLGQMVLKAVN